MKTIFIFILTIVLSTASLSSTFAQKKDKDKTKLTGILTLDSQNITYQENNVKTQNINLKMPGRKSRWLAGLFSLILPGAGEYYAGSYLKGAIFTVVEAAAITTALIYNHKGDYQTGFFENYANKNWYVAKYAYWTLKNAKNINPDINPDNYTGVFRNGVWAKLSAQDPNTINWQDYRNDIDWTKLNELESAMSGGYTHQLPYQGEQQYYELIGKYRQYSHGWATANINDSDYHILTPQFEWYAHQRAVANDFYQTGTTAVVFIYINHVLSALDAIWTTDRYNKSVALKFRMERQAYSYNLQYVPTVHLSVNF